MSYAIVALTLLAPAMGGSTEQWAIAVIAALTGSLFLIAPPRRALPLFPTIAFATLLLLAGAAFLPAMWSHLPPWRLDLIKLGADLPITRSPQPWLTLQWWLYLLLILCWCYYLFSFPWTRGSRERCLVAFAVGVLFLAALMVFCYVTHTRIPFWPRVPEYGFFPNRNQTSNVLGLAGILIYAIGLHRLQEHRPTWWVWLCSLSLICWALILNYSRSGIVLFFGGALLWHLWWVFQARERRGPLVALVSLGLLFGVLLLNGGKTLARFQETAVAPGNDIQGGRIAIFQDALSVIHQTPVLGIGLGNFRSLFSSFRSHFWSTSEAVHPESDWLWAAADVGWLGPAIVLLLLLWWLGNCLPFTPGSARALRIAGLICGLAFAVHGIFDVSAHRLGTLWPVLFIASISLHPNLPLPSSVLVPAAFRVLGFTLLIVSGSWFTAVIGDSRFPTTGEVTRLENEVMKTMADADYNRALALANRGLDAAPLNWALYYQRGVAEAALFQPRADVMRDFALAQYLFPVWPDIYLKEGATWIQLGEPDLAFEIWTKGMSRLGPNAPELFDKVYAEVKDDPELRDEWRHLAQGNPRLTLQFLGAASPTEFQLEITDLLTKDPDLRGFAENDLLRLIQLWAQKGDQLALLESIQQHPSWQVIAWREWARLYAGYQDYRQACEVAMKFAPAPKLPDPPVSEHDALARRFQAGSDPRDALSLALVESKKGDVDEALKTLSIGVAGERPPIALYYLEARLRAAKGDWPKAWQAMAKYLQL